MMVVDDGLAAVRPIIHEVISSNSVTEMTRSLSTSSLSLVSADAVIQQSSWLWRDKQWLWLIGGVAVGFYFGFRIGVVSGRARRYVASKQYMKAAALNSYEGIKAVSLQNVEVPIIVKENEIFIEVRAASLDPVDLKVSQGFGRGLRELVNRYNPNTGNQFPVILGRDGTGVVKEVGGDVE